MCGAKPGSDRYIYKETEFPISIHYDIQNRKVLGNEREIIQRAIDDYETKTNFKFFTLLPEQTTPMNIEDVIDLHYARRKKECSETFKNIDGVLASATYPPYKSLCLEPDSDWNEAKLKNVIIHELGHNLGLDHDNSKKHLSIMNAGYNPNVDGLQPADIATLRKMFTFLSSKKTE